MFKLFLLAKAGGPGAQAEFRRAFADFAHRIEPSPAPVIHEVTAQVLRQGFDNIACPEPWFDLICTLAFEDAAPMLSAWRALRGHSRPTPPAPLMDAGNRLMATQAFVQRDLPPLGHDPRKLFVPVRKRPDRSRRAFHDHWQAHGPLILAHVPGVRGYIQNHMIDEAYEEDPDCWGGVAEFWFDSIEAVSALPESDRDAFAAIADDELAFLGPVPIENFIAVPLMAAAVA